MMKRVLLIFISAICLWTSDAQANGYKVAAKHAIAVELDSGKILYEKKADTPVAVASVSKLLTTYLVYKEVHSGKLKWTTPVTISNYPYDLTTNYTINNVPLEARKYPVKDLLKAMIIANANSPAIALAEKIGGTEPKFVDKMKKQLRQWGIDDAKLVNASGLPNSILGDNKYPNSSSEDENYFSARDLAIITSHLLKEFPDVLELSRKPSDVFDGQAIFSTNYMLKGMPYFRDGVDGLFIGSSAKGGSSFVATSIENNMRIISVILTADNTQEDKLAVFDATNKLLQYVLTQFKKVTVLEKHQSDNLPSVHVLDSPQSKVKLVPKNDLVIIKQAKKNLDQPVQITKHSANLFAPLKKGQVVTSAKIKDNNLIGKGYIGELPSVDLIVQRDTPKSFFLKVWWNHFVRFVNQKL
ncbi:D-alanyl-D-alanine carboxypeptidase PBP3 [Streptococcus phocae subsp. phocae]